MPDINGFEVVVHKHILKICKKILPFYHLNGPKGHPLALNTSQSSFPLKGHVS